MRRRILIAALGLALLAGAGIAAAWVWYDRQTRDVRGSSTLEFETTEEPGTTTRPEEETREEPWPTFGFEPARTRVAPEFDLRPPYRRIWLARARGGLIEFPPVVAYGRLYLGTNKGRVLALDAESGEIVWEKTFKRCIAASPTVADDVVYVALMAPNPCRDADRTAPGYILAFDADTGRQLWRYRVGGAVESSPVLVDGLLYFGSWDRRVYALDVETQRPRWTYRTGDEVKGAPAYANGTIFIGSYDGNVYALDARSGELRWRAEAQERFGRKGTFYSTPAVAYGRVYIGNTDGKVYAFGARSGRLLWVKGTGGYVYSSPAVWRRTVYIGSQDGRLYALDAATGDVRWSFDARGGIFGSPAIIAGIVYFASTERGETWGLDARTGERLWTFPDGKYNPVVADSERLYLTGYGRIFGLEPSG